jgi:hypothetical protein
VDRIGNSEATGNLKDRHAGYAESRISSILNDRTTNSDGAGPRN